MLSFVDRRDGCSRREFLRVGALGLGGLTLPGLLAGRAAAAAEGLPITGKSVIFLYQHGGPSQFETFDPKMTAPSGIRSVTGETPTSVPGVTFGGGFTNLARLADRLAVVRSFRSGSSAHGIRPLVGDETLGANIGSLYARVVGTSDERGMPTNTAIFPNAVDPDGPGPNNAFGVFASSGSLGASYAPFVPGAKGDLQKNMRLNMDRERLDDRRRLLTELDRIKRQVDSSGVLEGVDHFRSQAFDVILGGVADAFDLSKEDPRVLERYDTAARFSRPASWRHKNNRDRYTAHARSLGKLLLLARRLCEAGCGFVTVNTAFVWDMHADVNNLGVDAGMEYVGLPFDHAVSTLVDDLESRGLQNDILLVATGEMGRTPKINKNGGRDHWGRLTPLMLYGGGLTGGQVIGQSTRDGGEPAASPVDNSHLVSTLMHTLFDVGRLRITRGVPTDVARAITGGEPIRELVG